MSVAHCSDNVHSLPTLTPVSLPSVYSRATTMLTKKCARLKRLQRCRSCLPSTARGVNYRPCGMRSVRHYRVVRTRSCSNISKITHTVDCRSRRSPDHRGILLLLLVHGGRCRGNISNVTHTVDCRSRRSPDSHSILLPYGGGRTNVKDSAARAIPLVAGCLCTAAILECIGI